jgi:hypothetical protein
MLALTLDSASNNDTMVKTLQEKVAAFAGKASQIRCFNHVLNLTAHTLVKQFDTPKAKADTALAKAELALLELAANMDIEEEYMAHYMGDESDESSGEGNKSVDDVDLELEMNDDGWFDERDHLTDEELEELTASVRPVHLLLVKVRFYHDQQTMTHQFLDTQNLFCDNQLLDPTPSQVEGNVG